MVGVRRLEVITGVGGRRAWSHEDKGRIVAESFAAGANVSAVARRYGLRPQQVYAWRRLARGGALALPAAEALGFVPVVAAESEPAPSVTSASMPAAGAATPARLVYGLLCCPRRLSDGNRSLRGQHRRPDDPNQPGEPALTLTSQWEQIRNILVFLRVAKDMRAPAPTPIVEELRERIRRIEGPSARGRAVLPFGIKEIDRHLPGGGLALGALHEVAGGGNGAIDGAAAALFAAGIAARTRGKVLWCITRPDLFAPALAQAGLKSDRVIYLEAGDDKSVLACFEEGLRHGGLGAVVAEVARLPMTASRRLHLAAEGSGTIGMALRRWRRQTEASDFGQPTAAVTRWRVSALPSAPLPVAGVGRPRWLVELIRCRAGESADFELEACDDTGRLALPSDLVDGSGQTEGRRRRASA